MAISQITLTIRDDKRQTATTSIHVSHPDFISEGRESPLEFAAQLAETIDEMIQGQIVAINVTTSVPLPGTLKTVASVSADVEEGASFLWRTENGYTVRQRIPTFSEGLVLTGGTVDTDAAEVGAFITLMLIPEDLPADWAVGPSDSRGDDVRSLIRAVENFKRSTGFS